MAPSACSVYQSDVPTYAGRPWFGGRSGCVGFVMDSVVQGQGFSEYCDSRYQFPFLQVLPPHSAVILSVTQCIQQAEVVI